MNQEEKNRLQELKNAIATEMADQEFMKKMAETESPEEISALLAEKGISATAEQIAEIIEEGHVLGEKVVRDDGELDMEALEQVAGGGPMAGLFLAGIFLIGGIALRRSWKRTLICAGAAFAIGCIAPCP